ncbi:MAG: APC family permease [Candidatus Lokiarchaeota archaeon]|nr:APC family permease [Candidatus Harpocratesius repetitus]
MVQEIPPPKPENEALTKISQTTIDSTTKTINRYGLGKMISQGMSGTIGGPIFVILGYALSVARTGLLIALILNGLLMLGFVMIFSELALSLPISGGGYSFSKEAIGGVQGFLIGWLIWIGNLLFIAISGIGFAFSLIVFLPDRWIGLPLVKIIGFCVVIIFFFVNYKSKKLSMFLSRVLTFSITGGFLFYIIGGLIFGSQLNPDFSIDVFQESFSFSKVMTMTAYTFVIYCVYEWNSTFESMTASFDSIKRPRKTIPRAFIFSILIAIGIYWLVTLVTMLNIGSFQSQTADIILSSDVPLADAFGIVLNNQIGIYFMGFIGMIATITSINSGLQMSSHVLYSMARDGFMPPVFKKERHGIQWVALLISTILALVVVLTLNIDVITEIINFIFLVSMIFMSISLIVLRKTRPNLIRPWKSPFFPYLSIFSIIVCFLLISTMITSPLGLYGIVFGILILVFGGIYYLFQISRRDRIFLILYGAKIGISLFTLLFLEFFQVSFVWIFPAGSSTQIQLSFIRILTSVFLIFGILSLFFDLIPTRQLFAWATQHRSDSVVVSGIVQLSSRAEKHAHFFAVSIAVIQFVLSSFFLLLVLFFSVGTLSLQSPLFNDESGFLSTLFITTGIVIGVIYAVNGGVRIIIEQEYLNMNKNFY